MNYGKIASFLGHRYNKKLYRILKRHRFKAAYTFSRVLVRGKKVTQLTLVCYSTVSSLFVEDIAFARYKRLKRLMATIQEELLTYVNIDIQQIKCIQYVNTKTSLFRVDDYLGKKSFYNVTLNSW